MKKWVVPAAAIVGLAALADSTAQSQPKQPLGQVLLSKGWLTSYESARAEAQRTGKPLMVVFRCEP
jgi:hypothetical protein